MSSVVIYHLLLQQHFKEALGGVDQQGLFKDEPLFIRIAFTLRSLYQEIPG